MTISTSQAQALVEGFLDFMQLCNPTFDRELNRRLLLDIVSEVDPSKNILNTRPSTHHFTKYLIMYMATMKSLPMYTDVVHMMLVVNTLETGGEAMKNEIQALIAGSPYLQSAFKKVEFKTYQWEFTDYLGEMFIVTIHGVLNTIRGTYQLGTRPRFAIMHDLMSQSDALNDRLVREVEHAVYTTMHYALHPQYSKVIWTGFAHPYLSPIKEAYGSNKWNNLEAYSR